MSNDYYVTDEGFVVKESDYINRMKRFLDGVQRQEAIEMPWSKRRTIMEAFREREKRLIEVIDGGRK